MLAAAYAAAGYVLVRVVLPPQQLLNGARLKLVVVDGFIERIETRDVPERVRHRITTLVGPLTGRRGLTLRSAGLPLRENVHVRLRRSHVRQSQQGQPELWHVRAVVPGSEGVQERGLRLTLIARSFAQNGIAQSAIFRRLERDPCAFRGPIAR